jgi:hypothetical protein
VGATRSRAPDPCRRLAAQVLKAIQVLRYRQRWEQLPDLQRRSNER